MDIDMTAWWTISRRELHEALRNKWLWFYAAGFAVLAFALAQAGVASSGYAGLGGFGRTAASLINAILLFAPLIGLSVGATTLAGERERGTLLYLLAQPVSRGEVYWGKVCGAAIAVIGALSLGFGIAGLAMASGGGGNASAYLALAGHTFLLALASLGVGFLISTLTRKSATAMGAALLVWLALVFVGDLGLMGITTALRPAPDVLLGALLVNPLQIFKLGAIYSLRATLDTLGPAGQFAMYRFGAALPLLLVGLLVAWIGISFGTAFALFSRRGDA